ncbi:unknown seed protein USP-like [Vicia villosa]|uniref:unknown seed protein USP-like n=1 Tax=Vicia villosa TaxID=3911 RepID=UPI00273C2AFA|nr:unknown seed protein USP-like [Vicia villosa]
MEFTSLSILALLCVALMGTNASKSGEEYWKSIWPDTPVPKILSDLVLMDNTELIRGQEMKQYWTVFFNHDLYPGKQISLGIQKQSYVQPSRSNAQILIEKASPHFSTKEEVEKSMKPLKDLAWHGEATKEDIKEQIQPFGAWRNEAAKKENEEPIQPFGAWRNEKEIEEPIQPFGAWRNEKEIDEPIQPFGAWRNEKEIEEPIQPFGAWRNEKEIKEPIQPFEAWRNEEINKEIERPNKHFEAVVWPHKTTIKKIEKVSQTSITRPSGEKEAHVIHDYCEKPSAIGEDRHCVTSLESMMDFAISKLGKNIKVMSSSFAQNQNQYVMEEVRKIGDKAVMCHKMNLKNVVFYCHQVNATTIYKVPLVASDGTKSNALTICHHDTRGMNANALYKVLKVRPGTVPICHFIGNKAIAWVPNDNVSEYDDCPRVI